MKARRTIIVAALAAVACLLPATVAHAAVSMTITSPGAGATVTSSTDIEVDVSWQPGQLDPHPQTVDVRLLDIATEEPIGDGVRLACQTDQCRYLAGQGTWGGESLDPATLAPFTDTTSCNGVYAMQARFNGNQWGAGIGFVIALPPSAPTGVEVTTKPGQATVTWTAPPQPDLTGFAVERRAGGDWTRVAEPGADATSYTDRNAPSGSVEYRVVAFRGDGMNGEDPVAACEDTGRDLSATSSVVSATVPKPPPSPSPTDTETGGTATPTDGATDGTEQPTDGTEQPTGPTESETGSGSTATEDPADADPTPTPSSERVAPPESVETTSRPEVDVPDVATDEPSETETESFYGDDLGFSEEIDYGDLGTVQATGEVQRTVTVRVPGALQGVFGETVALQRVMTPVAGGMILLSFGLHLRRWARAGLQG